MERKPTYRPQVPPGSITVVREFGVDVLACWSLGKTEFAIWFTMAGLLGNFLFVRIATRFSLQKSIAADVAMTGASYLLVVTVPISLAAFVFVRDFVFKARCCDPYSWMAVTLMAALTGAASGLAVLALFKQKGTKSAFCWLIAMNLSYVAIAAYRMWVYIMANPPVA
jgi:hypothetical protein